MKPIKAIGFYLLAVFGQGAANAGDTDPINLNNSLPLMSGAGLISAQTASIMPSGRWALDTSLSVQSHANISIARNERLVLDAEVQDFGFRLRYGFAPEWQFEADILHARISGGNLDSLIDNWHQTFGFTEGDRNQFLRDQLRIEYQNHGATLVQNLKVSGMQDLSLRISRQIVRSEAFILTLGAGVNLPTGKQQALLGSDKVDYSLYARLGGALNTKWTWHTNLGFTHIGDDQLFSIETRSAVLNSSLGLHWQPSKRWRWSAQLDSHSAVFESEIDELSSPALQLALGSQYRWLDKYKVQLYFTEDLVVNKSADFGLGVNWGVKF